MEVEVKEREKNFILVEIIFIFRGGLMFRGFCL